MRSAPDLTHEHAVAEAQTLVRQFRTAYPDEPRIVTGKLAKMTPAIDLRFPTSLEQIYNLCVMEIARSLARVDKDGLGKPSLDANPTHTKSHKSLTMSGLAPAGGLTLSQRLALQNGHTQILAPNLKLAALLQKPAQRLTIEFD